MNVRIFREPTILKRIRESEVIVGFATGDTMHLEFTNDGKMLYIETDKHEHYTPLVSIDVLPSKNLMLTACQKGIIKLWTMNRKYICEFLFCSCDSAGFIGQDGAIGVSSEKRITKIHQEEYLTNLDELIKVDQP